jgi:para-nitrobenzyl esterase
MMHAPLVNVSQGKLAGAWSNDGAVASFKGVPYAQPPLGALRWQAPQAPAAWNGERPARRFGARCPQPGRSPRSIGFFVPEPEDEDCLYLNVWTASLDAEARRPVMLWFHGGAFYLGSGAVPLFDGEALARKGAVVVTVNFRLGRLGFLAHPLLSAASPEKVSGNYGLRDQIAALEWVRDNVAAFGGDTGRITLFGQSAGAASVSCLMASPRTRGLFHRGIGQSGGAFGKVGTTSGTGDSMQSLEYAERSGRALAEALGVRTLDELLALPAQTLQLFRPGAGGAAEFDPSLAPPGAWDTAWPIVDGAVLPEGPAMVFRRHAQHDVPLITGANGNEGATMPAAASAAAMRESVQREFGALAASFLDAYPCATDAEARASSRAMVGDRNFVWQNRTWARLHAQSGRSAAYHYEFARKPPIPASADYLENAAGDFGAFHGAEIPYVFRNLHVRDWPWQASDRALSELISAYWLNFARSGNPNGPGLPEWPAFDAAAPRSLRFDERSQARDSPTPARLQLWDRYEV